MSDTTKCDGCGKVIRAQQDFLRCEVTAFGPGVQGGDPISRGSRWYDLHNSAECAKQFQPHPWEQKDV